MNILTFPNKLMIVPDCSNERFEDEEVFNSLEEFMNRNKPKVEEVDYLKEVIEMKARIKYYLNEIEMFTPRRIMDLSLKKARKLEAKIATFINQKKTELNTQESIRLSSDITSVTTQVSEFRTTFFDNLKLVNDLITVRQEIRDQISEANFNTGIDNLISNKVLLENKIAVLNAFVGHDIYDQGEVEDVLALGKKQLEGGSHYVRTSTEISFLNQVDKDKIRTDKQTLQKEIEAIEDKLAELNYSSKLRLNSITTKLLQDNNLI